MMQGAINRQLRDKLVQFPEESGLQETLYKKFHKMFSSPDPNRAVKIVRSDLISPLENPSSSNFSASMDLTNKLQNSMQINEDLQESFSSSDLKARVQKKGSNLAAHWTQDHLNSKLRYDAIAARMSQMSVAETTRFQQ